jgi:hypothetical protein
MGSIDVGLNLQPANRLFALLGENADESGVELSIQFQESNQR